MAGIFGEAWTHAVAAIPWLLALVAVGLPHGAADLAVSRRLCPPPARIFVWVAYLAIMAATAVAFAVAPAIVVGGFVVLSAWHFGLPHGGIAIGVPLVFWPAATAGLGDRLLELTGHAACTPAFSPAAVAGVGVGLVASGVAAAGLQAVRAPRPKSAAVFLEIGALAALAALGIVADPLFSVGCGFLAWHAWRQMEPLAAVITGAVPRTGRGLAQAVISIHVAALPLLMPMWIVIGCGWWLVSPRHTAADLAILSVAAYLLVTPAHEALGAALRPGILFANAGVPRSSRAVHHPSAARCVETSASSSG